MKYAKTTLLLVLLMLSMIGTASAVTINSIDDVDQEGLIVGVQSSTTADIYAQENFDEATINAYDTILLAQ